MEIGAHLSAVREQYETYPYPQRDPEEERGRLVHTWLDNLAQINHYCYRGRNDFSCPLRVLVAGGGTGDATIFLASQLAGRGGKVVHLDMSRNSMEIARKRAAIRELGNITWVHAALADLPALGLGKFDYINCSGVLHHLPDPQAGLDALLAALADDGALSIMVYGRYGRSGVYPLQDLMRIINRDQPDMQRRMARAKAVLSSLPDSNWWRRADHPYRGVASMPDAEICDHFLHAQDRSYTVPELYDWIEKRCGLRLHLSRIELGSFPYQPRSYVSDPSLLQAINALPLPEQHAVAELIAGNLDRHSFYATRAGDTVASLDDLDNVPFFFLACDSLDAQELSRHLHRNPGQPVLFTDPKTGAKHNLVPGKYCKHVFRYLDGERSLREIFRLARNDEELKRAGVTDLHLLEDFRPAYRLFNAAEGMLLRHQSVGRFPRLSELQA